MAYRPFSFTTTSAAQQAVTYDENRTNLVITNLSGETAYKGVDTTLTTENGSPIFNNGRFESNFLNGTDPRIARFLIGTAGGDIRIEEEFSNGGDR
jgi:hypothetical protein